jgi:TctA family transporter
VLVTLLPFLQPVVEAFGSPEIFFLALFGIVFIGALGEGQPLKGLIAGALGIFLACFGYQAVTGVPRFWLDFDYLLDGFRLVPMGLGLFAVPQILDLMSKGGTIASMGEGGEISWRQVGRGVLAVCHRWRLLLGSSAIGTLVGIVPGVGGDTATFVAYGWARQASKNPDDFGTGAIEGVIAPEASNNAKEGGSLVPTLAFGVPGSVAMAILLGAFLILGLEPGPYFLVDHLDMALGLAFVVAAANLLGAVIILPVVSRISLLTRVDGQVLGPLLLVLHLRGAGPPHEGARLQPPVLAARLRAGVDDRNQFRHFAQRLRAVVFHPADLSGPGRDDRGRPGASPGAGVPAQEVPWAGLTAASRSPS